MVASEVFSIAVYFISIIIPGITAFEVLLSLLQSHYHHYYYYNYSLFSLLIVINI